MLQIYIFFVSAGVSQLLKRLLGLPEAKPPSLALLFLSHLTCLRDSALTSESPTQRPYLPKRGSFLRILRMN